MQPSTSANSGDAPIVKMGHTTNGRNGSDAGTACTAHQNSSAPESLPQQKPDNGITGRVLQGVFE